MQSPIFFFCIFPTGVKVQFQSLEQNRLKDKSKYLHIYLWTSHVCQQFIITVSSYNTSLSLSLEVSSNVEATERVTITFLTFQERTERILFSLTGSMKAASELVKEMGGVVALCLVCIELADLKGRDKLKDPCESIVKY